jgi:O-antigen/teichoic acid export membrane protein
MKFKCRTKTLQAVGILLCLLLFAPTASAYLDPSTGSMVVSAIVGIFASIALAVKTYWYKIKNLFRRRDNRDSTPQDLSD